LWKTTWLHNVDNIWQKDIKANYVLRKLKVWWPMMPLFFILLVFLSYIEYIQTYCTYIHKHSPRLLSIPLSQNSSVADTFQRCRVEIQTRAPLTASPRATNWASPHPNIAKVTLT
jgi:hypothetical protein